MLVLFVCTFRSTRGVFLLLSAFLPSRQQAFEWRFVLLNGESSG